MKSSVGGRRCIQNTDTRPFSCKGNLPCSVKWLLHIGGFSPAFSRGYLGVKLFLATFMRGQNENFWEWGRNLVGPRVSLQYQLSRIVRKQSFMATYDIKREFKYYISNFRVSVRIRTVGLGEMEQLGPKAKIKV